jgi:fructose 1,6-bisphosphatase
MSVVTISAIKADIGGYTTMPQVDERMRERWEQIEQPAAVTAWR